jgi:hypothetical protein
MRLPTSTHTRRTFIAVFTGAVALAAVAVPAQAQAAPPPSPNVVSSPIEALSALSAADYWTPARMASAIPADLADPTPLVTAAAAAPAPPGPPVSVNPTPGTLPAPTGPQPLAATSVARPYTNLPDRLNGKVFFSDGASNFVCSGTVVNSTNKDMVDTAGHCVSNGAGRFFTNWIFVPGYSSAATGCRTTAGCFPFGKWTARRLTARTEWHNFGNFKQDLGYAVLNTLGGQHIANRLGGQGTTFNASRTQTWRDFGYPQAAPFNGFDQKLCVSGRLANDNPTSRPGPLTMRISCNMTGGSSGGGWLINLSGATGLGFVNSHNSYKYVSGPLANSGHMYGPYYGAEAQSLFNSARLL